MCSLVQPSHRQVYNHAFPCHVCAMQIQGEFPEFDQCSNFYGLLFSSQYFADHILSLLLHIRTP